MQMFNGITSRTLNFCRARYDEPEKVGENQDSMKEKYDKIMKELDEVKTGEKNEGKNERLVKLDNKLDDGFGDFLVNNPDLCGKIIKQVKDIENNVAGSWLDAGEEFKDVKEFIEHIPLENLKYLTDDLAEGIGYYYHHINLDGITTLTESQAKALHGNIFRGIRGSRVISLNGLTNLNSSVVQSLTEDFGGQFNNFEEIHLDGLTDINQDTLNILTLSCGDGLNKCKGISLCGLKTLPNIDRKGLNTDGNRCRIWLDESLEDEVNKIIKEEKEDEVNKIIKEEKEEELGEYAGENIDKQQVNPFGNIVFKFHKEKQFDFHKEK